VNVNAIGREGDTRWFGNLQGVNLHFAFPSKTTRLLQQKVLKRSFRDVQTELLGEMVHDADCDVNVATYCLTAFPTFESGKGSMFYLVQNYEPLFFADPAFTARAEKSYNLPLTKLCVSRWLQRKVGGIYIGNGVNTQIFHAHNTFEDKEPDSVLYLHRGIAWKGDTLAMETLQQVHRSNPKAKIHIAARAGADVKADFSHELHSDPTDKELAELYSRVRVLLFTSNFEGYGLPPLEALACGTNVVSTNFYGNEYLIHEQNCLLANEFPDLARAIAKLMKDDATAQAQLRKGARTVDWHDFEAVTDRVLDAFNAHREA
ncbi:MAG: glycosyltransferase family 4 protein, partial [Candidatus Bathyarchaeia archaeon]